MDRLSESERNELWDLYEAGESQRSISRHLGRSPSTVRWNQWRIYPTNFTSSDNNPSLGGYLGHMNETAGYPMIFNIEADPREMRATQHENTWVVRPYSVILGEYLASLQEHPNPPAANLTRF